MTFDRARFERVVAAVLALCGVGVAVYAVAFYDIGRLRRMGPGFFPLILGGMLAVIGGALALARPPEARGGRPVPSPPASPPVVFHMREMAAVLTAIGVFAIGLRPLGVLLCSFVVVLVASWPAPQKGVVWRIALASGGATLVFIVFVVGLRMNLPLWPIWFGGQ